MKEEEARGKMKDIDSELEKFKQALLRAHINKRPSVYHICIGKAMGEILKNSQKH